MFSRVFLPSSPVMAILRAFQLGCDDWHAWHAWHWRAAGAPSSPESRGAMCSNQRPALDSSRLIQKLLPSFCRPERRPCNALGLAWTGLDWLGLGCLGLALTLVAMLP